MPKKVFDEQLAALEELRRADPSDDTTAQLRKALKNRNNYIAAKAARIAGDLSLNALIPDLLAALDRFFIDPAKSDPQCWAKIAIVKALGDLGHTEAATYLRGLRYHQMEPVWGGAQDSAGPLRCQCALALVDCRQLTNAEVLTHLIELLADSDKTVRAEAARAIGRMNCTEAVLLLRLRALLDGIKNEEPEVLGACFSALISIEGREVFDFLRAFVDRGGDVAGEAVLAVGMMRGPEAFAFLKKAWEKNRDPDLREPLLTAIAMVREEGAIDFLIALIESDSPYARGAIEALSSASASSELRARVEAAIARRSDS